MKHTDGPWNVAEIQTEDWRLSICADDCEIGCAYHRNDDPVNADEETYATARLIAAAPELLEACKWLLFHAENGRRWKTVAHRGLDFTDDEFEGRLRAAISKAEGGA